MDFIYKNIAKWIEKKVKEASDDLDEQLEWAYTVYDTLADVINALEKKQNTKKIEDN